MSGTAEDFLELAATAGRAGLRTRKELNEIAIVAAQFGKIARLDFNTAGTQLIQLRRITGNSFREVSDAVVSVASQVSKIEKDIFVATTRAAASI